MASTPMPSAWRASYFFQCVPLGEKRDGYKEFLAPPLLSKAMINQKQTHCSGMVQPLRGWLDAHFLIYSCSTPSGLVGCSFSYLFMFNPFGIGWMLIFLSIHVQPLRGRLDAHFPIHSCSTPSGLVGCSFSLPSTPLGKDSSNNDRPHVLC